MRNTPLLPCFQSTANRDAREENFTLAQALSPSSLVHFKHPAVFAARQIYILSPPAQDNPIYTCPSTRYYGAPFHSEYPNIGDECYKPVPVSLCIQVSFSTFSVRKPTLGEIWKPIRGCTEEKLNHSFFFFPVSKSHPVTICLQETSPKIHFQGHSK